MTEKYYFTFGTNHFHPETNIQLSGYWIEIEGSYYEARNKMFKKFGSKWSFQYNEDNFESHYFPKGCYEKL